MTETSKSCQQLQPLAQGGLEIELTAHGSSGDCGNPLSDPGRRCELINRFLAR